MVHQELLLRNVWNSQPDIPGHEILMTRLECQCDDGNKVPLSELDAENLMAHAGQPLSIVLPCGHAQLYMYAMIRAPCLTSDVSRLRAGSAACLFLRPPM